MHTKWPWKSLKEGRKWVRGERAATSSAQTLAQPTDPKPERVESKTIASSGHAIEQHSSRSPDVVNSLTTPSSTSEGCEEGGQPGTTSGFTALDLPVKPGAEESETSVTTTQQIPTLSTSQRLWNAAYDSLEKDAGTAELVQHYLKTMARVLGAESELASDAEVSINLKDPTKRQMFMEKLVKEGKAKVAKASKATRAVDDFVSAILSLKPMADLVIESVPQAAPAALPWAGVCLGLQILSNPGKATKSNLAGIAHVIARMDWYCVICDHLLKKDESFTTVLQQLEIKTEALYRALLRYQMESVCSYYRHQGLVFLRGLANLDNWDDYLKAVKDAEDGLLRDWETYDKLKARSLADALDTCGEEAKSRLGNVDQSLQDLVALQKQMRLEDKHENCLRDLFLVDPHDDMEKIEMKKDRLFDGAYRWILDTEEYAAFTTWNSISTLPSHQLLWIKGHAGTGKTMLLMGVIRELLSQPATYTPSVAHFFCQGADKALNSATATLRSLIWLLLVQQPHLISHIQSKHENAGSSLFSNATAFITLSNAFKSMIEDPGLSPVYFVIDALDECEQGLSELIELIQTSLPLSNKVKWLLSSRPSVELKTTDMAGFLVELDAQKLKDPVDAYIDHKISVLRPREGYDEHILAQVATKVRQRANNIFLWVALVFKELDAKDSNNDTVHGMYALEVVEEIPSGLSELYNHMMTKVEGGLRKDPQYCKAVLMTTVLTYRPLTLLELAVLADLPPGVGPETIVRKCGSFLATEDETVYLIHQSAKDYLKENFASKLQNEGLAKGHADIGRRSIEAMSSKLTKNMYKLPFDGKPKDGNSPNPDPLGPLRYSCIFWADHLCDGGDHQCIQEMTDDGEVFAFLKSHFLHWLESLSLLGKLPDGVVSIRKLLDIVYESEKSLQLVEFLKDAEKFVLSHGSIIEQAPVQIYGSAIVFTPAMSEVKKTQWGERFSFIESVTGIRESWGAHQQTLEGHTEWINAVVFSPDGRTVASAADDKTVRLWDAITGAPRQTLEGHMDRVNVVVFSPGGEMVASAADDSTIRLWDAATGELRQTLEGHTRRVKSIVFSPDGKTVASASDDNTVRLWDAIIGAPRQTLVGHTERVNAVVFSPDGKTVASAAVDTTVRLWDATTGLTQQTLEGHAGWVTAVVFSPDGKTVASASGDETVRLWDTRTGAPRQTLEGHTGWVNFVVFSPDGKTVASASGDETVRLWDATTGAPRHTLEGHTGWVTTVVFSPDGRSAASASGDKTVRMWDVTVGAPRQTFEGHTGWVNAIMFSPDGRTVASAADDDTIRLWDTTASATRQIRDKHTERVTFLVFSPDGKTVAAASYETVQLWDAITGEPRATLEGHTEWVYYVLFSPDNKTVASVSSDDKIRLWDATTGAPRLTFDRHKGFVSGVAFSPDNVTAASVSGDDIIRVWDTTTGTPGQELEGHTELVITIIFSPDGRTIASAGDDTIIRLWDTTTGAVRQTLKGHTERVNVVAFSPDGKTIASASDDNTVRVWDATTGALGQTVEVGTTGLLFGLSFDSTGSRLHTDVGDIVLSDLSNLDLKTAQIPLEKPGRTEYGVSPELSWITGDSKNLVWLPPEYRAVCSAIGQGGLTVAVGCKTGQLLLFRFSECPE